MNSKVSDGNRKINQLSGSNTQQIMQILTWHEDRLNHYNDQIVDLNSTIKNLNETVNQLTTRINSQESLITTNKKEIHGLKKN